MQTDSVIQSVFTVMKNIRWRNFDNNDRLEWYYAESMHYVVHDKISNAYWFIKAKSPANALEIVEKRNKE